MYGGTKAYALANGLLHPFGLSANAYGCGYGYGYGYGCNNAVKVLKSNELSEFLFRFLNTLKFPNIMVHYASITPNSYVHCRELMQKHHHSMDRSFTSVTIFMNNEAACKFPSDTDIISTSVWLILNIRSLEP